MQDSLRVPSYLEAKDLPCSLSPSQSRYICLRSPGGRPGGGGGGGGGLTFCEGIQTLAKGIACPAEQLVLAHTADPRELIGDSRLSRLSRQIHSSHSSHIPAPCIASCKPSLPTSRLMPSNTMS